MIGALFVAAVFWLAYGDRALADVRYWRMRRDYRRAGSPTP